MFAQHKVYFNVIADARLKLEEDTALAMLCIVRETVEGHHRPVQFY